MGDMEAPEGMERRRPVIRPTLVIGLGGTGHHVVARLKARYLRTFGPEILKLIKVVVIDTAQEDPVRHVRLEKGVELINIGGVPTAEIVRAIEKEGRHPEIAKWLPKEGLPHDTLLQGAKQIRPLGRLAFFWNYAKISSVATNALDQLTAFATIDAARKAGFEVVAAGGVNVFIVCSVCGGTGGGTFLDMSYLVKHLWERKQAAEGKLFTNLILVLPGAFNLAAQAMRQIQANTYTALSELNDLVKTEAYGGARFAVKYPNEPPLDVEGRPFNVCYLIDNANEEGRSLQEMEQIAPLVADYIFLHTGTPLGTDNASVFDNVNNLTDWDTHEGQQEPTAYSSFGTSSLIFPAAEIIRKCAEGYGKELVIRGILRDVGAEPLPSEDVTTFIQKSQLAPSAFMPEMGRDNKGQVTTIRLVPPADVEKAEYGAVLAKVDFFIQNFEAKILRAEYRKYVDQNRLTLQARLQKMVEDQIAAHLDDSSRGLKYTLAFIEELARRLDGILAELAAKQKELENRQKGEAGQIGVLRQALEDAIRGGFPIGKKGKVARARTTYLTGRQKLYTSELELVKHTAGIALIAYLKTEVLDRFRKRLETLRDNLQVLAKAPGGIIGAAPELGFAPSILTMEITSDPDVRRYYQEGLRDFDASVTTFWSLHGPLSRWLGADMGEIAKRIAAYAISRYKHLEDVSLEDIIRAKEREMSSSSRLEELRDRAKPFWSLAEARISGGMGHLYPIVVVGVYDPETTLFRGQTREGEKFSVTRDKHVITVLHTKHGLPIFALRQYDGYKQAYRDLRLARKIPFHISPDLARDLDVSSEVLFALALALGFVKESGIEYVCSAGVDGKERTINLGDSLGGAVQAFAAKPEVVESVSQAVRQHIQEVGKPGAKSRLEEFYGQSFDPSTASGKLLQRFQKLVETYIRERF